MATPTTAPTDLPDPFARVNAAQKLRHAERPWRAVAHRHRPAGSLRPQAI